MQKKSKVIAFRVSGEEYEAIIAQLGRVVALNQDGPVRAKNVNDILRFWLNLNIQDAVNSLNADKKKAEAAAKRKAARDAKKVNNDPK